MALSKKVKSDFNLITKDLLDIPTKLKDNTYKDRSLKVLRSSVGKYNRYFFNNFLNRSDGLIYSKNRSVFMDNLITAIYKAALNKFDNFNKKKSSITLIAVGGYGRREMAPYSDVDLLILTPNQKSKNIESIAEFILYMLWDIGLKVGHAVRNINECIEDSLAKHVIATSMLDMRFIAGNKKYFDELKSYFVNKVLKSNAGYFLDLKIKEREERHLRMGDSRYLVEPNVKECKGGLRDLQTLFWMVKYVYGMRTMSELVAKGVLSKNEKNTFDKCRRFLLSTRCGLHLLAGRLEDRLTFDFQYECAKLLGYSSGKTMQSVEKFMKNYYLVAKSVGDLTNTIILAVIDYQRKSNTKKRKILYKEYVIQNNLILIPSSLYRKMDERLIFESFSIIANGKYDLHPDYIRFLRTKLKDIKSISKNFNINNIFLKILTSKGNPGKALRAMNEVGVLGEFLPDFKKIVGLSQFDMYHLYTVDEHLIRAVEELSKLEKGLFETELSTASKLIKKINLKYRKILFLAVFFHDIAKGRNSDHSYLGKKISQNLGKKFFLDKKEIYYLSWLIENHLSLSNTAFKRDIHDTQTIIEFTGKIDSIELLELLYILTIVDIRATNPELWNNWKESLLSSLFVSSKHLIEKGKIGIKKSKDNKESFLKLFKQYKKDDLKKYIKRFDNYYWATAGKANQKKHAKIIFEAQKRKLDISVSISSNNKTQTQEIHIYAKDREGFFSRACGSIALSGGNIAQARIATTNDGMVMDSFLIHSFGLGLAETKRKNTRMKQSIIKRIINDEDVSLMLNHLAPREKKRTEIFKVNDEVIIDNISSKTHTILEINARDRIGLLCAVSQKLYQLEISVSSASISTFGEQAMDSFYIREKNKYKVVGENRISSVRQEILDTLKSNFLNLPNLNRNQ